jgi:hypothetical protein
MNPPSIAGRVAEDALRARRIRELLRSVAGLRLERNILWTEPSRATRYRFSSAVQLIMSVIGADLGNSIGLTRKRRPSGDASYT